MLFFLAVWGLAIIFRPYKRAYKLLIIGANLVFYSFFGVTGLVVLVSDVLLNYGLLKILGRLKAKKKVLGVGVGLNLLLLSSYKYFNNLTGITGMEIIAPIGVSFFTFKIISVLIDSYRQKIQVNSLADYLAYVSFFPQISAGPIARFKEFAEDINQEEQGETENNNIGPRFWTLIISGWLKMYLIGSYLYEIVNQTINAPQSFGRVDLILGMMSLSFFIFANFSGYSDISEALAMALGFRTPKNFNNPYRAVGIRDFWQRWHMSLSTWLKDYLYIPMGGNRRGRAWKYCNLLVTMVVGGMWHGAEINFLVWGGLQGEMLMIDHFLHDTVWPKLRGVANWIKIAGRGGGWLITFGLINISWIIFYPKNMEASVTYFEYLIRPRENLVVLGSGGLLTILILAGILSVRGDKFEEIMAKTLTKAPGVVRYVVLVVIFYLIITFGPSNYVAPAAYFNF